MEQVEKGLISGKEALIALANGEEVEVKRVHDAVWQHGMCFGVSVFFSDAVKFRLKPRTITINEIEVPTCGTNYKPNTYMFILNSLELNEYSKVILDESDEVPTYWWHTEDEIKQVVAALRKVFKGE